MSRDRPSNIAMIRRVACRGAVSSVVITLLAAPLVACNILGPAAYLALGQPKVDAQYELSDRPTVVFVDDRTNAIPLGASRIRRAIADKVTTDLMTQEVLTQAISSGDVMTLARQREQQGNLLAIEDIGRSVGAEQVIFLDMLSFRGSTDGFTPRPTATCRVKVVDVTNRTRLFPDPNVESDDDGWRLVSVTGRPVDLELYRQADGRREIQRMLARQLGDRVAKLFYRHVPNEIGSRLEPR